MSALDLAIVSLAILAVALPLRPRWVDELALDLINGFKAARRQRAMINGARAELVARLAIRPRPVRVGSIAYQQGNFVLMPDWDWEMRSEWFRSSPHLAGYDIDGQWRAFGYTQRELEEIHARRAEFNV